MSLSTFGAIMKFASEMIEHTLDIYEVVVKKTKNLCLKETLQALLVEEKRNFSLVEQARRENVTEMILEPITGLYKEDYKIDLKVSDEAKDIDLLKIALLLEEKEQKFFNDCSNKVPHPEVANIFRKIAQRKEKNRFRLLTLSI